MSGLGTGNGSERELDGQVAGIFQAVWNSKSTTFQDGKLWAMSLECQCLKGYAEESEIYSVSCNFQEFFLVI